MLCLSATASLTWDDFRRPFGEESIFFDSVNTARSLRRLALSLIAAFSRKFGSFRLCTMRRDISVLLTLNLIAAWAWLSLSCLTVSTIVCSSSVVISCLLFGLYFRPVSPSKSTLSSLLPAFKSRLREYPRFKTSILKSSFLTAFFLGSLSSGTCSLIALSNLRLALVAIRPNYFSVS